MTTETTKMAEAMEKAEVKAGEKAVKKLREISLDSIEPDPGQPRKNKPQELIDEMGKSIASRGLINPITIRPLPDTKPVKYRIIMGENRWRAHCSNEELKAVGKIKAFVDYSELTELEIYSLQILENAVRKNLDTMEDVDSWNHYLVELGGTIEDIAASTGKTVKTIEADLPLANLTMAIRSAVDTKTISKEVAREIAKLGKESKMEKAYAAAVRSRNSKQQLANVQAYANQASQTTVPLTGENAKPEKSDLKKAGGYLDALLGSIKRFAGLETDRTLMIKARSKKLEEVEVTAKEMIKQAEILLEHCRDYRAKTNTQTG